MQVQTTKSNGKELFCGYKVVRENMTSLGLRNNPNIMTFRLDEWSYFPEERIIEGIGDYGGIWLARTYGRAKAYKKYMRKQHDCEARIFLSLIDRVLLINQDRLKTNGIKMLEELE
jgi:hypothetical protein